VRSSSINSVRRPKALGTLEQAVNDVSDDTDQPLDKWLWHCPFQTAARRRQRHCRGKFHLNSDLVKPAHRVRMATGSSYLCKDSSRNSKSLGLPALAVPRLEAQSHYPRDIRKLVRRRPQLRNITHGSRRWGSMPRPKRDPTNEIAAP